MTDEIGGTRLAEAEIRRELATRSAAKPIRFHRSHCSINRPFNPEHPGPAATCTCGADPTMSPIARAERGELFPLHPNEGRTLYPYTPDVPIAIVRLEWFEAYENLVTYRPEFAEHPGVRFVIAPSTGPIYLRVTAPLEDRPLAARALRWTPSAMIWVSSGVSISTRPRRQDDGSVVVVDAREWSGPVRPCT